MNVIQIWRLKYSRVGSFGPPAARRIVGRARPDVRDPRQVRLAHDELQLRMSVEHAAEDQAAHRLDQLAVDADSRRRAVDGVVGVERLARLAGWLKVSTAMCEPTGMPLSSAMDQNGSQDSCQIGGSAREAMRLTWRLPSLATRSISLAAACGIVERDL